MGYLNNNVVTVDAILTKKGRELLARGDGSFRISQFALSDDEIDYTQYNPNHPSGSAFYGEAIENMPILEAFPSEDQIMKYKLTTLPRGTSKIPILGGVNPIILKIGESRTVTPETFNYEGSTNVFESSGYTATIADVRLLSSFEGIGISTEEAQRLNATQTIGTNVSKTVIGTSFNIVASTTDSIFDTGVTQLKTSLTIVGRDSGARVTVPVTVKS